MHACCGGLSGTPQRAGRKGYKALTVTQEVLAFSVPPQDRELRPEEIEGKEFGEEPQVWGGMGWEMGRGPQQCPGGTRRKKNATGTRARTEDETERGELTAVRSLASSARQVMGFREHFLCVHCVLVPVLSTGKRANWTDMAHVF